MPVQGRPEFGASTFCASRYANEQCGSNGLPLTPNSIRILGRFQALKLIEHPRLCKYLDLMRTKHERVIVVAEHYENNLLSRIKSASIDRSPATVVRLAYDVLTGLAHMNSHGLVHRNLSPSSLLFDSQDNLKLSNYGLYHMTGCGSDVSFPIGVPKYLAPEVLCSPVHCEPLFIDVDGFSFENTRESSTVHASSAKSDVWSLGIILLEFIMGQFIWDKLSLRQIFFKIMGFLKLDVHPFESIVSDHQAERCFESLPSDLLSFLKCCLTLTPSARPLPCDLLRLDLFADLKPPELSRWSNDLNMFCASLRCLNLELPSVDDINGVESADVEEDLLSERHITEIYYLWKLAGGDLESCLRKAGLMRQRPPITQLPYLVIDDGESFGEMRDSSTLFDNTVVILSQDQLRQRLKDIEPAAYYPLLENDSCTLNVPSSLPNSQSSADLQESARLPLVIRERDIEYQFHRIILFERLLTSYPYKRQHILKEARRDVPPLFRAQIWAAILEVEGDVQGCYETIDKESPITTDRQIEVDIPRCHQYNELLSSPTGHSKFRRLLKAWVVSHPEYVYWQGLDSLCAPFLYLNFNNEALAYACLSAFVPKYLHNFFLKDNACVIQEYLTVFSHLIAFHEPLLSRHLDDIGFIPDLYAIPWFLTMYAHVFPLHKIFHLWDMLLLGNSSFPLCIGVAILQQLRDQLLKFGFNECILLFSDMPEIDIERCVQDSIKLFCSTPKSATYRQHAWSPKTASPSKPVHSYYTQDYHEAPKTALSMDPITLDELKSEKFPRISAEDLMELCGLSGSCQGPSPSKMSSMKPVIVVVDVRSEDEYKRGAVPKSLNIPFHTAFSADGELIPCLAVTALNQHKKQVKVVVGGSRGRHTTHFAESLIHLGYSKVCVLHKGIDVLRPTGILTIPTPEL